MILLCVSFQSLARNRLLFPCISFSSWDQEGPVPSTQQLAPDLLYQLSQESIREPEFSISTSPYETERERERERESFDTGSHYIAHASLELKILLCLPWTQHSNLAMQPWRQLLPEDLIEDCLRA